MNKLGVWIRELLFNLIQADSGMENVNMYEMCVWIRVAALT